MTSLNDSLDGNSSFKLKILNGYMNQSAVIRFNRTGNSDGVFIAAHDKTFSRESVGDFIHAVIEKVSSGTGQLSEKLQRGVDKVYDTFNSIPGVDLGNRPNVTLSSDKITQQLSTLANFFDLDEAMTLKIGAEKPKSNPAPDPRPDIEQ